MGVGRRVGSFRRHGRILSAVDIDVDIPVPLVGLGVLKPVVGKVADLGIVQGVGVKTGRVECLVLPNYQSSVL